MYQTLEALEREITELVIGELSRLGALGKNRNFNEVPVSVSGRHLHLSRVDMDTLFGVGSELTRFKDISQPGQFAANERVTIEGAKGKIENLRVLGPLRPNTQIELAASDARRIGINPPVRASGDIAGSLGVKITGPVGSVMLKQGCILAERHIHMTPAQAQERGLKEGQSVSVRIGGEKGGVFDAVYLHVREDFALDMHIDADDANAFLIGANCQGTILAE